MSHGPFWPHYSPSAGRSADRPIEPIGPIGFSQAAAAQPIEPIDFEPIDFEPIEPIEPIGFRPPADGHRGFLLEPIGRSQDANRHSWPIGC